MPLSSHTVAPRLAPRPLPLTRAAGAGRGPVRSDSAERRRSDPRVCDERREESSCVLFRAGHHVYSGVSSASRSCLLWRFERVQIVDVVSLAWIVWSLRGGILPAIITDSRFRQFAVPPMEPDTIVYPLISTNIRSSFAFFKNNRATTYVAAHPYHQSTLRFCFAPFGHRSRQRAEELPADQAVSYHKHHPSARSNADAPAATDRTPQLAVEANASRARNCYSSSGCGYASPTLEPALSNPNRR